MYEREYKTPNEGWEAAITKLITGRMGRQEEAIKLILQGDAKLSDWPEPDTQLAQCRTCKGFSILQLSGTCKSFPGKFNPAFLKQVHSYKWQCDRCGGAT